MIEELLRMEGAPQIKGKIRLAIAYSICLSKRR